MLGACAVAFSRSLDMRDGHPAADACS